MVAVSHPAGPARVSLEKDVLSRGDGAEVMSEGPGQWKQYGKAKPWGAELGLGLR
jgi:hypothetical protein